MTASWTASGAVGRGDGDEKRRAGATGRKMVGCMAALDCGTATAAGAMSSLSPYSDSL